MPYYRAPQYQQFQHIQPVARPTFPTPTTSSTVAQPASDPLNGLPEPLQSGVRSALNQLLTFRSISVDAPPGCDAATINHLYAVGEIDGISSVLMMSGFALGGDDNPYMRAHAYVQNLANAYRARVLYPEIYGPVAER